ncbi:hypothetical protein S40285_03813 [Stachybotrys chlorohalonatus IBT 40285]|uniref:Zn(2)-C6 fungal-type domain-containing protein n=1 Tax=Stachybotrys chlorohalonatus (strain IBT 40285) TaxID=1283841 RepID=A0A084QFT4_STAC4|nr:hypothetical protein S40285_03813 [Stachybotrys chlorohalonata IBT 40285]
MVASDSALSPGPLGTPAGYGRSCTNCSKAKCKCILRTNGASCERCHRLGKECHPMTTTRKRISKKAATSRTAQLEEKLDDLVSILRASQQPGQQSTSPVLSGLPSSAFTSRLDSLAMAATAAPPQPRPDTGVIPQHTPKATDYDDPDRIPEPSLEEAEARLMKFRTWLRNFPFMHIGPDVTARKLQREQPFLWLCIANTTSISVREQRLLRERVRREIAEKIVINQERSMELLLGLLAYTTWATMNTGASTKPFLASYSQLAATIVYDLGLTWSPTQEQRFHVNFRLWKHGPFVPRVCTMEERRAVIALWYLTSIHASILGKMDSLRWTSHMQDCLEILEREKDHELDDVLVSFVKVQRVGDEAYKLLERDVIEDASQAPAYVFKKSLLNRLDDVRRNLSPGLASHAALQAHLLSTEILIHLPSTLKADVPNTQKIESMYASLAAMRSWYDIFFSIPATEMMALPFSFYVDLFKVNVSLYRLTTSEEPGWDRKILQGTADLLVVLDQSIEKFQQAIPICNIQADDEEEPLFARASRILRSVRNNWEPLVAQSLGGLPTPNSQAVASSDIYAPQAPGNSNSMMPDPSSMDSQDYAWMSDVFGPWEF